MRSYKMPDKVQYVGQRAYPPRYLKGRASFEEDLESDDERYHYGQTYGKIQKQLSHSGSAPQMKKTQLQKYQSSGGTKYYINSPHDNQIMSTNETHTKSKYLRLRNSSHSRAGVYASQILPRPQFHLESGDSLDEGATRLQSQYRPLHQTLDSNRGAFKLPAIDKHSSLTPIMQSKLKMDHFAGPDVPQDELSALVISRNDCAKINELYSAIVQKNILMADGDPGSSYPYDRPQYRSAQVTTLDRGAALYAAGKTNKPPLAQKGMKRQQYPMYSPSPGGATIERSMHESDPRFRLIEYMSDAEAPFARGPAHQLGQAPGYDQFYHSVPHQRLQTIVMMAQQSRSQQAVSRWGLFARKLIIRDNKNSVFDMLRLDISKGKDVQTREPANRGLKNWTRVMRAYLQINTVDMSKLDVRQITQKLQLKNDRTATLNIYGRWAKLARGVLGNRSMAISQRWKRLVRGLAETYPRELNLRVFYQLSTGQIVNDLREKQGETKTAALRVLGNWRKLLAKIRAQTRKRAKIQRLTAMGRWLTLSSKLLELHRDGRKRNEDEQDSFTRGVTNYRAIRLWRNLVKKVAVNRPGSLRLRGHLDLDLTAVNAQLRMKKSKLHELGVHGRWNSLSRGLLRADNMKEMKRQKLRRMNILGRWRRLVNKANAYNPQPMEQEMMPNHEISIQCSVKWRNLVNRMLQKHTDDETYEISMPCALQWRRLVNKALLAQRKMAQKDKKQHLNAAGRWRILANKLLRGTNHKQAKKEKQRKLRICGKWNIISKKLVRLSEGLAPEMSRSHKAKHLRICGKWNFMAKRLLLQSRYLMDERKLVKSDRTRRLHANGRLSMLARKLLKQDQQTRRWKKLIYKFFNSGMLVKNDWEVIRVKQKLLMKQLKDRKVKLNKLKVIKKWSQMVRMLLEYSGDAIMVKSMQSLSRNTSSQTCYLKSPNDRWSKMLTKIVFILRTEATYNEVSWMSSYQMMLHKYIKPNMKEKKMRIIGKWNRLTRKILHFNQQKKRKIQNQWKHLCKSLMLEDRNYRLLIQYRTARLVKKYIIYQMCSKQIIAQSRFQVLAKRALINHNKYQTVNARRNWTTVCRKMLLKNMKLKIINNIMRWSRLINGTVNRQQKFKHTPLDRWEVVLCKMIIKVKKQRKNAGWLQSFEAFKVDMLIPEQKKHNFRVATNLKRLANGLLKREKQKHLLIYGRLVQLIVRYVQFREGRTVDPRKQNKRVKMVVDKQDDRMSRWTSLVKGLKKRHPGKFQVNFIRIMKMRKKGRYSMARTVSKSASMKTLSLSHFGASSSSPAKKSQIVGHGLPPSGKRISYDESEQGRQRGSRVLRVKNKEVAVQRIREGQNRLMMNHSVDVSFSEQPSQNRSQFINPTDEEKEQMKREIELLEGQLSQNQMKYHEMEQDFEMKFSKFNHTVELGKQRENKLMFFLYVLKEEKKCPVTEVFNDFIKPIETTRFTVDYGEDYKRVLKKIKKQARYEKIFNRVLRKMRVLNNNKEYKSDSCLQVIDYEAKQRQFVSTQPKKKIGQKQPLRSKTNFSRSPNRHLNLHIKQNDIIRIQNKNKVIKMPALNIMSLGTNNRAFNNMKGAPLKYLQGSSIDKLDLLSSSSEDSKGKANIKDIVFDPRQRKRLLDSLNIVTTRDKWKNLNEIY